MYGLSAVTSPMLFSTICRQTSRLAVIPQMQRSDSVLQALPSRSSELNRL